MGEKSEKNFKRIMSKKQISLPTYNAYMQITITYTMNTIGYSEYIVGADTTTIILRTTHHKMLIFL